MGTPPEDPIDAAQANLGVTGTTRGNAVKESLIRNMDILQKLGCLDAAGMAKLRTGNAPTITQGPYAGDIASVDHIIPRSVCEEQPPSLLSDPLNGTPKRPTSKANS